MLALALLLDAGLGEPDALWRRVPHPAVLFGRLIAGLEARLNRGTGRRGKGVLALVLLIMAAALPAVLLAHPALGGVAEVAGAAILLAQRSLIDHVRAVAAGLRSGLEEGRRAVAMIVGRDTGALDASGVARAAIESAAENFSDGVVAPAFWFAVAGLPGIAVYKAVNTADSMIGHRSARYRAFGWAAARLDDGLNLIPARLAGLMLAMVGGGPRAVRVMWRDARRHRSPNAGWPEAAMAASLGLALAGPRVYAGVATDDAPLNPEGRRNLAPADIDAACTLLWRAWAILLALAAALALAV